MGDGNGQAEMHRPGLVEIRNDQFSVGLEPIRAPTQIGFIKKNNLDVVIMASLSCWKNSRLLGLLFFLPKRPSQRQ
jgi:hypothetical protein